ncbi:MAG: MBL fold metallo-hydrolase [Bdellovibrionaceae bacterium]|nr:MBL fold metallo-hydrolase [Pseudobdellovibrionaceae bacterium]
MSLSGGYSWSHKNVRLVGYSMAGITTSIAMPEADVVFDVAQGLPFQMNIPNICLTHGHMDHASGVPYVIGQKSMQGQIQPNFYMPSALVQPMREMMRIWERIEDHTYQYQFVGVEAGRSYPLKSPYFFRTFPTSHRVPSVGYTVFEKRKHLKDEYKNLTRDELIELRRQGVELEEHIEDPLMSFTGDTRIEFLDGAPWVKKSKVLVTEVTFVDSAKSIENAREWGHLHLDELLPRLDSLKCEKVVLIHISARYTTKKVLEILDDKVPEHWKTKVEIFPRPI